MAQGKNFQRRKEDFICSGCGALVKGNGYTDHCPHCLLSIHVDVKPGDRASKCRGEMIVMSVEKTSHDFKIMYRCRKCGIEKKVVAAEEDNRELLTSFAAA
jgi:hypothetical protein